MELIVIFILIPLFLIRLGLRWISYDEARKRQRAKLAEPRWADMDDCEFMERGYRSPARPPRLGAEWNLEHLAEKDRGDR